MQNNIFIIAALSFITFSKANAQKGNEPHLGLRVGANFSNIIKSGDNNFSTDIKVGFNVAAFLEIPIIKTLSVQPELQFTQKGYRASGMSFIGNPYDYRVTTNFIEVPLLARIKPSSDFAIVVGPQFSFLTSTNTKFITSNALYESNVNNDNSNLRKNLLGGVLGVEASSGHTVFSLRYSLDFQSNNGDGTSSTPKYKNQLLGLSIGFRF